MALSPCPECGTQVGDRAESCPSCGSPLRGKSSVSGCFVVLMVLIFGAFITALFSGDPGAKIESQAPRPKRIRASLAEQAKRSKLIDKLTASRVIQKIDTSKTVPRLYVLPAYGALTFDEKQDLVEVCYGYTNDISAQAPTTFDEPMLIYDGMTNKRVGEFRPSIGLELD
jgi:hypothetical protein